MMAMAIEDSLNLDFMGFDGAAAMITSTNTTTTTTTTTTTSSTPTAADDDHHLHSWRDWSSVVDWDALFAGRNDDFADLIDPMMDDTILNLKEQFGDPKIKVSIGDHSETKTDDNNNSDDDAKGLRLVHLLMAAAEALTGPNKSRELARVILVRLEELASPCDGTNMERVAAYFTDALYNIVEGVSLHNHAKLSNGSRRDSFFHQHHYHHSTDAVLAAYQLLQDISPYVKFGHFTANQAILEAVSTDRRVHIVDYDIMEGIQWASLMQDFVSRKDGPPGPHLRITAISRGANGRSSVGIGTVQETGRRLVAFAASIGQPFSFHLCRLDPSESFRPGALKLVKGETLVFNCTLNLPHFSNRAPESIASFLSGAKSLNPRLVTLVEEEIGPVGDVGFVGRFMDSLYHYSAVYDSLESGFPMQSLARGLVERVFLGPRIVGSLARIYRARPEEEVGAWREYLLGVGFRPASISFANHCQAKLLLGLFNNGYRVEEVDSNRLVLGWKCRRLLSASIWTSNFDSD